MIRMNLARVVHEIWAHWMNYMFTQGRFNANGEWTMPEDKVKRWTRQANTKFDDLSVSEQTSDYNQADKILVVVEVDRLQREFEERAESMMDDLENRYRPSWCTENDDLYESAWFHGKGLISLNKTIIQEHTDIYALISAMHTIAPLEDWE